MTVDLKKIAQRTGVKTRDLKKILWLIYNHRPISNNDLLRRIGLPKSVMRGVKKELRTLLKPPSRCTILTKKGEEFVRRQIIPSLLERKKVEKRELEKKLVNTLAGCSNQRPKPRRDLDQFPATRQTIIKRALFLQDKEDLENRKVLFLGDFDLTSIAVVLLEPTVEATVLDIDQRLLQFIKRIAQRKNLSISTFYLDLRDPLPDEFWQRFDLVFADPPYTPNGLKLFLSRALQALKGDTLYFCYGYSCRARERGLKAQEIFTQSGLIIGEKREKFNRYIGAEAIGSNSALYLLQTTPKTKILIKGRFSQRIYTHQH